MRLNRTIRYVIIFYCLSLSFPTLGASTEDWFTQGVAHIKADRLDKAIEALTRSIEMIPYDYEAYSNRGIAYSRKGKTSLAEIDFSKALKLNPKFYDAYLNRGIARQKQGAYASALRDYVEAYLLKPDNKRPQVLLAWVLATCPDSRLREGPLALKIVQTLAHNRTDTTLFPLLAAAYAAIGDFETAIAFQRECLAVLYTTRADSGQVEHQQRNLARYQAGRPLQDPIPSTQNLSDNDTKALMAQVNNALKRSLPTTTTPITLANTKQASTKKIPQKTTPPESAKNLPPEHPSPPPPKKSRGTVQLSSIKSVAQPAPAKFPYVIVIGSFKNAQKGFDAAAKLRQQGHPVFTSWVMGQAGEKWYQIYYGWYPDKKSAAVVAAILKEKRFHSVLVRQAPFTLQIQSDINHSALESINKRLEQINLIGYQIDNRLMIGAYKEKKMTDIIMIDTLTAVGLSSQPIER